MAGQPRTIQLRRTLVADREPDALADGEIALGLGNDPPRMWIGTPSGVVEFVATESRALRSRLRMVEQTAARLTFAASRRDASADQKLADMAARLDQYMDRLRVMEIWLRRESMIRSGERAFRRARAA